MKCNFISVKLKDKNSINLYKSKFKELFKLSIGNNIKYFNYNKNKKAISNQNIEIIYFKIFNKKNIGKMIYKIFEYNKKIFNKDFITNNMKRAKIIIKNKQYYLKENIKTENRIFKIKIRFLDNIIKLNSMFEDCLCLKIANLYLLYIISNI